jgi:hypothetical protein
MKIWIGQYSDMSWCWHNRQVFTNESAAKAWREQAEIINQNSNDDIGCYSLLEVDADIWDGRGVVPYYEADICIDVEMPQHERAKVYYYKQYKWQEDEQVDRNFNNHNLNYAKERMIYNGMNYMNTTVYAHTKEELVALVEKTFDELGMRPQVTVYSENWNEKETTTQT